MTDQENESIKQLNKEIETLALKKEGLEIETENLNAQKEILKKIIYGKEESQDEIEKIGLEACKEKLKIEINGNPEAEKDSIENLGLKSYKEKIKKETSVLKKIIDGDKESQDEIEKMGLKVCKERLEIEINGNPQAEKDSIENLGLKSYKEKIEKETSVLKKIIYGKEESQDEIEKIGLEAYKKTLESEIYSDIQKDDKGNPILSVEIEEILNKNLLNRFDIYKIGLEAYREKLEREITGDSKAEKDSIKNIGLKSYRNNLEKDKNALEEWIYGLKDVSEEELKSYKKDLYDEKVDKAQEEEKIKEFGLKKYSEFLNNEINELRKKKCNR